MIKAVGFALVVVLLARGVAVVGTLRGPEPVVNAFAEDAYYMFAVARNVAAGEGMTAAHGERTSGIQPLWTVLLVPAFALFGDGRAVLVSIFLLSTICWLAAAWLFASLMTRHTASTEANLGGLAGALCLLVFLCDPRLDALFFSGLETACYAAGLLWLCRWLDGGSPFVAPARWGRCIAVGLLLGMLLLARNDAVLILPFVLVAAALAHPDRRTVSRIALSASVAAATFAPWLAYNYELAGTIMPQGGLAMRIRTEAQLLDPLRAIAAVRSVLELMAPPLVPGVLRLPSWCLAAFAAILGAGFVRLCRRNRQARQMARSTAWLACGAAALIAYYVLFSRATWMYTRYFIPIRLLALWAWMWLVLDIAGRWPSWRTPIVAGLVLVAVAATVERTARSFGSSTPFTGNDVRLIIAAGLCDGPARVGAFDSGRIGYRCAPHVVNLDGKASLAALDALATGRLLAHLAAFHIDWLFLRDDSVDWFDRLYPTWRQQFSLVTAVDDRTIFARIDTERNAAAAK